MILKKWMKNFFYSSEGFWGFFCSTFLTSSKTFKNKSCWSWFLVLFYLKTLGSCIDWKWSTWHPGSLRLWCWSSASFLLPWFYCELLHFSSAHFRTSSMDHVGAVPVFGTQRRRTRGSVRGSTNPFNPCCPGWTASSVMTPTGGGWLVHVIGFTVSLFSQLLSINQDMFGV